MIENKNNILINYKPLICIDSYKELIGLDPKEILLGFDLESISKTIVKYYSTKIIHSKCGNKILVVNNLSNIKVLKLDHTIAFGIKLRDFTGPTILSKLHNLLNQKMVLKKLYYWHEIYTEINELSHSNGYIFSDKGLQKFRKKRAEQLRFVDNILLMNISGTKTFIPDIRKTKIYKAQELDANSIGLEKLAYNTNQYWLFATISSPAKFHINPINSKSFRDKNLSPRDCNNFHNKIWDNTLRKFSKLNIKFYGHWSKEVNKSSAIHRHILLYSSKENLIQTKKSLIHYTRKAYMREETLFNDECSIKIKIGHSSDLNEVGERSSYAIAKYINKNISSCLNKTTLTNKSELLKASDKYEAHAALYKYRRFGFTGLKCLTLWRELKYFSRNNLLNITDIKMQYLVDIATDNGLDQFIQSYEKKYLSLFYEGENNEPGNRRKIVSVNFKGKTYISRERYFPIFI